MKKALATMLVLTMVASLAACGGSKSAETEAATTAAAAETEAAETEAAATGEDVHLRFVWWGNQVRTENTQAAIDMYQEENPSVTIEGQAYQWSDYWTVLATAAAGNALPDVIQQDYAYIEQFVASDDLVDLTPYIESGAMDTSEISDTTMATGMVGDGTYAICAGINAPCLIYNKTLTDSLGIEIPDGMTMDEFHDISQEIYEKSGVRTNYYYGELENMITYYVRSMDEYDSFFSSDRLTVDSADDLLGYFELAKQAMDEGWQLPPEIAAEGADAVETNPVIYYSSADTESWCVQSFSNQLTGYQQANTEIELAVTPYPSDNQDESNYLKPSQFFSVTTDTVDADAAVAFVNFLTNDEEANVQCLKGERGIPVNSSVAEAVAANASDDSGITEKVTEYINNVVTPHCSPIFAPLPDAASQVVTLIGELQEKLLYGKITPEEAANQLFEEGNAILAGTN